nr:MAG TPA: hypothetical protein [Caudoviricetes sp.]
MLTVNVIDTMMELMLMGHHDIDSRVRVHIGNQLYDIDHIDTVIDMDTNKPNLVIHVKEK